MSRFTDRPNPAGPEPTPSESGAGDASDEVPLEKQTDRYLKNILWSSVIWTIGNALTTGGFLTYFAAELGIRDRKMAIFLALPELVGGLALLTRTVDWGFQNRKSTWIVCSLLARVCAFGIPLSVLTTASSSVSTTATLSILIALGLSSIFQAMANVAWLSWMADLFPSTGWGRLLALRNMAILAVLLTVPVAVGYLRDFLRSHPGAASSGEIMRWFYLTAFILGNLIILISMRPLLSIPGPRNVYSHHALSSWQVFREILLTPGFRGVVCFHWWHAFWSGLTQVAFFDYRYHHLHVGLGTYYLLEAAMRLTQIPVSHWSGRNCDRRRTRMVLAVGVGALSASLLFWIFSTAEQWWWIWGAYLLWGAWGAINVAGPTLYLQYAPRGDNTLHLAIADRGAGMCAGIAGILGGILLAEWSASSWAAGGSERLPFVGIFAFGMGGRLLSLVWLYFIPVRKAGE